MSSLNKLTRTLVMVFAVAGLAAAAPATAMADTSASSAQDCVIHAGVDQMTCVGADEVSAQAACDAGYIWGAKFWDYKSYNGNGGTLLFCVPRKCTASYDGEGPYFRIADLWIWNNRISSVKTFNRCDVKFYGLANFNGASSTFIDARADLSNVGSGWNNRASSLRLS